MEYAHVPTASFKANRALFMEHFLDRPRIYMTKPFAHHEEKARINIASEVEELRL
jgi:predicted metal-dependent HD superfamily phosphohydrolase